MVETLPIEVGARDERGKNAARRLRVQGKVPATLYGLEKDPEALALDTKLMTSLLSNVEERNRVLMLSGGATGAAMISDWQVEPVYGKLLHVDLRRVDEARPVTARVALRTHGVPYGVKTEGGLLDVILRETKIRCLPADIPGKIDIDISGLRGDQSIRLRDLDKEGKFKFLADPSAVVVRVIGKRGEKTAAVEPGAAAEPAEE
jgi:large subunit ribosomal protein L25